MTDNADEFASQIADLAGVNLDDVEAVRYSDLPPMKGGFEYSDFTMKGVNTDNGPRLVVDLTAKVIEVTSVADPAYESAEEQQKLIDKTHRSSFFIDPENPLEGLGRLKAQLEDTGWEGPWSIEEVKSAVVGHKFLGQIRHKQSSKDKDRVYVNLFGIKETAAAKLSV